jgi:hypothetical protein
VRVRSSRLARSLASGVVLIGAAGAAGASDAGVNVPLSIERTGDGTLTPPVRVWRDPVAQPDPLTAPVGDAGPSIGEDVVDTRADLTSSLAIDSADDRRAPTVVDTQIDQSSLAAYERQMLEMARLWDREYTAVHLRTVDPKISAGTIGAGTAPGELGPRPLVVEPPPVPTPTAALALGLGLAIAASRRRV